MSRPEKVSFNGSEDDKQKPSKRQAHMHITQDGVLAEYPAVEQTLHEYLPEALHERPAEESSLKTQLVRTRQSPEPDDAAYHTVYQYEVQPKVEW